MFKAFVNSLEENPTSVEQLEELSGKADIVPVRCDKVTFGKYGHGELSNKIYTAADPLQKYAFIADSDDEAETEAETSRESSSTNSRAEAVNMKILMKKKK